MCVLYHQVVDELVAYPNAADTRDTADVLRLCTAYLKLLLPHVTSVAAMTAEDLDEKIEEFQTEGRKLFGVANCSGEMRVDCGIMCA